VAVVGDGRFDSAGTYAPGATSPTVHGDMLAVAETHQIAVVVPRAALAGIDLQTARYGVAMFGNGEAGEGLGYIRPVYDGAYWNSPPDGFSWIKEYRFGGGAGVWEDTPDHDTDTRDPNAIDVIVACDQTQTQVLNWRALSPSQLPMLRLNQPAACTSTPGTVGGTVPATLSLSLGAPASFGGFTPGSDRNYDATTTATITSSAGDASLSVTDPSSTATGRLVNGSFALDEPLQARASSAGGAGSSAFAPLSTTSGNPLTLLTYTGPIANDTVTIGFRQHIAANQALRTGNYAKTLTFTLSTTTP
jgi:hypothetical protein